MPSTPKTHRRKKGSKVTTKTHRKHKARSKKGWQELFRKRFFV